MKTHAVKETSVQHSLTSRNIVKWSIWTTLRGFSRTLARSALSTQLSLGRNSGLNKFCFNRVQTWDRGAINLGTGILTIWGQQKAPAIAGRGTSSRQPYFDLKGWIRSSAGAAASCTNPDLSSELLRRQDLEVFRSHQAFRMEHSTAALNSTIPCHLRACENPTTRCTCE